MTALKQCDIIKHTWSTKKKTDTFSREYFNANVWWLLSKMVDVQQRKEESNSLIGIYCVIIAVIGRQTVLNSRANWSFTIEDI